MTERISVRGYNRNLSVEFHQVDYKGFDLKVFRTLVVDSKIKEKIIDALEGMRIEFIQIPKQHEKIWAERVRIAMEKEYIHGNKLLSNIKEGLSSVYVIGLNSELDLPQSIKEESLEVRRTPAADNSRFLHTSWSY